MCAAKSEQSNVGKTVAHTARYALAPYFNVLAPLNYSPRHLGGLIGIAEHLQTCKKLPQKRKLGEELGGLQANATDRAEFKMQCLQIM